METKIDDALSFLASLGTGELVLTYAQWAYLAFLVVASFAATGAVKLFLRKTAFKLPKKKRIPLSAAQEDEFLRPVGLVTFSIVWIVGSKAMDIGDRYVELLVQSWSVVLALGLSFFSYRLTDYVFLLIENRAKKTDNTFDDILVPFLRKAAKVAVVVLGFVFTGHALAFNMANIIAGLGIGGLAFAFAAKDTIANLFGSVTVILDRPFGIGDWVVIDGKIEGIVEEVGIRSTRVRTFYDSLVTVPNGSLAGVPVDNYGQRTYRRFSTKIAVEYGTPPEKIEDFCEGIRELIRNGDTTRKDNFYVYLNDMGDSSLDILLYVFWEVPTWGEELACRHRLLSDILILGQKLGVGFAFPTRTVHLAGDVGDAAGRRPDL